ncbi:arginine-tRNA-protein transferase [Kipferlia bialata]|uniref:arginyltransferase n=1 Tax=Kipferlia bialata TaxID=797122 RepID=A0A9K3CQ30_9EUKA|nr:arginine-tRNA-protein transferase [Kipferlia bialata]|eukprot:g1049.t1
MEAPPPLSDPYAQGQGTGGSGEGVADVSCDDAMKKGEREGQDVPMAETRPNKPPRAVSPTLTGGDRPYSHPYGSQAPFRHISLGTFHRDLEMYGPSSTALLSFSLEELRVILSHTDELGQSSLPDIEDATEEDPHQCSYLPSQRSRNVYIIKPVLSVQEYRVLLDHCWRRCHDLYYRPVCPHCVECRPIRLEVDKYKPDRNQRRCFNRNKDLVAVCMDISLIRDAQDTVLDTPLGRRLTALWTDWERGQHDKVIEADKATESFSNMLVTSGQETLIVMAVERQALQTMGLVDTALEGERERERGSSSVMSASVSQASTPALSGTPTPDHSYVPSPRPHVPDMLVAWGKGGTGEGGATAVTQCLDLCPESVLAFTLCDAFPDALSSVYAAWDVSHAKRGLGTWLLLAEVAVCMHRALPLHYLGYYNPSPKMTYKARFKPCQVMGWNGYETHGE